MKAEYIDLVTQSSYLLPILLLTKNVEDGGNTCCQ